mmetsp:Transcript_1141/g.1757  ORF Transcript_1141/g.1757 Transcript_1141/m.1757 type:complete len:342 (-) Transcript_1141:46-1071(-)
MTNYYRGAVIFLHGSGDTGPGAKAWVDYISCGDFERTLSKNDIICSFPTALLKSHFNSAELPRTIWFDRSSLSLDSIPDEDGMLSSMDILEAAIRELEEEGIPRSKVIIGGFSMGGGFVLQCAIAGWINEAAGAFCLGNFLTNFYLQSAKDQSSHSPPLYISHGCDDDLIPIEWASITAETLKNYGFSVNFYEYAGLSHDMSRYQLMQLAEWIINILCMRDEVFDPIKELEYEEQSDKSLSDSEKRSDSFVYRVAYSLEMDGNSCIASFRFPAGARDEIISMPFVTRGSCFQLLPSDNDKEIAFTKYLSPSPEETAFMLAQKIERRMNEGMPPGLDTCMIS